MAVESANYISQLDSAAPVGTDQLSTADDHLRVIKQALLGSFPNSTSGCGASGYDLSSVQFVATESGSAAAFEVAPSPQWSDYANGLGMVFVTSHANTARSPTLQVNALDAVSLLKADGTAFEAYEIPSGTIIAARYYGGSFYAMGTSSSGSSIKITGTAAETITAGEVVYGDLDGGVAKLYVANSTAAVGKVLGIALNSAIATESVTVLRFGFYKTTVTGHTPLFVDTDGSLTGTPPSTGFVQQIATVVNEDDDLVLVDPQPPILLVSSADTKLITLDAYGNLTETTVTIEELTNVVITDPADLEVLQYDSGTSTWVNSPITLSSDDITDIDVSGAAIGQVLKYDGTKWVPGPDLGTGSSALDDAVDCEITSPANREHLIYENSTARWKNQKPLVTDNDDVALSNPQSGDLLKYDGSGWVNAAPALDGLSDVIITTPASGQFLVYNGTKWANTAVQALICPVGTVVRSPTAPTDGGTWLLCSGDAVSRSTYAGLFALLGHRYMPKQFYSGTPTSTINPMAMGCDAGNNFYITTSGSTSCEKATTGSFTATTAASIQFNGNYCVGGASNVVVAGTSATAYNYTTNGGTTWTNKGSNALTYCVYTGSHFVWYNSASTAMNYVDASSPSTTPTAGASVLPVSASAGAVFWWKPKNRLCMYAPSGSLWVTSDLTGQTGWTQRGSSTDFDVTAGTLWPIGPDWLLGYNSTYGYCVAYNWDADKFYRIKPRWGELGTQSYLAALQGCGNANGNGLTGFNVSLGRDGGVLYGHAFFYNDPFEAIFPTVLQSTASATFSEVAQTDSESVYHMVSLGATTTHYRTYNFELSAAQPNIDMDTQFFLPEGYGASWIKASLT